MNIIKLILKNKATKIWLIVSLSVMVFILTVSIIITQVGFLRGTLNIYFGGDRAIISEDGQGEDLFFADYSSKDEVLAAAKTFNIKLAEEGIVLLKNDNQALPLGIGNQISVFGKNSVNLVYGGSGSGATGGSDKIDLYESLEAAGFEINPTLLDFYQDDSRSGVGRAKNPEIGVTIAGFATGETAVTSYDNEVRQSYSSYADAAIVVISRIGGEGFDLPRTMLESYEQGANKVSGAKNGNDHYLELDQNEEDMLIEAYTHFNKVILLLNTPSAMEVGFLNDESHMLYSTKLEAALWIGFPGGTGADAIGRILNGSVNPSGRTTDTYARDFTTDPTYFNFGNNNVFNGNRYTNNGELQNAYFVDYEEGIYIGYRYYETRGETDGETWYENHVVFPFGYGLSYTTFSWDVESVKPLENRNLTKNGSIEIEVEITNTGNVAGKDVIQLYYTAPYTDGGIEKAHVVLGDFAKTSLLEPGASEKITLNINVEDMKSYDWNDANQNGFKGYELEAGQYEIHLAMSAHDKVETITYQIDSDYRYDVDNATGNPVTNLFDDVSNHIAEQNNYLTRSGWQNFPTTPTALDREVPSSLISAMNYQVNDEGKPWYVDVMPSQANTELSASEIQVTLDQMYGLPYDDELWDQLLDQLTIEQMAVLIGTGAFGSIQLENIGKPLTTDSDGPSGFTNFIANSPTAPVYDTNSYVAESLVGATWNKDLAYEMGKMIGNEALIGNERGDGLPYSGWYAPAVNIHRSPFSGRNWEYYGEDGYISGVLGAEVVKGAKEKGVYTFVKHFAVNDQETNRDTNGLLVWVDEQAMREIYFKPFEIIVKEGETTAMMSAFNRLGTEWTGGSYNLLTALLRHEWGFKGMVITDYALNRYLKADQMIRAGGDLALTQGGKIPSYDNPTATQTSAIRMATKNILYTVANSNAMNVKISGYLLPVWVVWTIWINVIIDVSLVGWGILVIIKVRKKPLRIDL
ncbi:MAG: glycoside hydrolase family 3 C-terminal domain-containing protein [Acholeplasmataceae bacterium]|jgi:beta-glucosidase|nr:glycoside hydrolase family 3 C-terminal domain-containing protein [Acholeplasmataceae bacterium]